MVNFKIDSGKVSAEIKGPQFMILAELETMIFRCIKEFAEVKKISYDAAKLEIMCDIAKVEAIEEMENKK